MTALKEGIGPEGQKERQQAERQQKQLWLSHLESQGMPAARVALAQELVAFCPRLGPIEARSLVVLVLVSLEASLEGSTYVPFFEDDYLLRRFHALIPGDLRREEGWQPAMLRNLAGQLLGITVSEERQEEEPEETQRKEPRWKRSAPIYGRPGEFKPLIVDGDRIYQQRVWRAEKALRESIAAHLGRGLSSTLPDREEQRDPEARHQKWLKDIEARPTLAGESPMDLNEEQVAAALMALGSPLSIITGGPGTGKTSIVVAILRLLIREGLEPGRIALAAPTGKAAHRMAESIGQQLKSIANGAAQDEALQAARLEPKTLHRLLGTHPRRRGFLHNRNQPLGFDVVIVDEASMIDLFLMEALVQALAPNTRLILLGDKEQLPSVELGAVLRDLLPPEHLEPEASAPAIKAVELKRSYRMDKGTASGRRIFELAQEIRAGKQWVFATEGLFDHQEPRWGPVLKDPRRVAFEGVEWLEPHRDRFERPQLYDFLDAYFRAHLEPLLRISPFVEAPDGVLTPSERERILGLFEGLQNQRILTLTRVLETGSEILNAVLHQRVLRHRGQGDTFHFAPGEPVMVLRNDYEKGLFNGDQGVVIMADRRPMVAFPGQKMRLFPLAGVSQNLEHSFVMTVHKAQGSEFNGVALVLPGQEMSLLSRELLYTAVTRAREWVLVVGERRLFVRGVARRAERYSGRLLG